MTKGEKGSVSNKGITWDYYNRESLAAIEVTAENKRMYMRKFMDDFIEGSKDKVDSGELTQEQVNVEAGKFARNYINFYKKMERKYRKGDMFLTWKGKREPVVTEEKLSRMRKYMEALEEKYKTEEAEKESAAELIETTNIEDGGISRTTEGI